MNCNSIIQETLRLSQTHLLVLVVSVMFTLATLGTPSCKFENPVGTLRTAVKYSSPSRMLSGSVDTMTEEDPGMVREGAKLTIKRPPS